MKHHHSLFSLSYIRCSPISASLAVINNCLSTYLTIMLLFTLLLQFALRFVSKTQGSLIAKNGLEVIRMGLCFVSNLNCFCFPIVSISFGPIRLLSRRIWMLCFAVFKRRAVSKLRERRKIFSNQMLSMPFNIKWTKSKLAINLERSSQKTTWLPRNMVRFES